MRRDRATLVAGAEHTSNHADSRPDSAASSCPKSKFSGWRDRTSVRRAARRDSCVHPRQPTQPLNKAGGTEKLITEHDAMTTPTAAPSSDHTPALSTSATPTTPDAEERLAGLVVLLGDIAASIAGVRVLVRDLETLQPGHGHVIGDALAVAGFLADFGAKYGGGSPSFGDAPEEWMLSDRAMRAGVGA